MINKFQQGGNINQQLAQELVTAGLPKETVQQLAQNQDVWTQLVQIYQQQGLQGVMSALQQLASQQQAASAKKGAKLNYLKRISNNCPEGTRLVYFKAGGQICSKCEAIAKQKGDTMADIKKEIMQKGNKIKKPEVKKKVDVKKETTPTRWTPKDDKRFAELKSTQKQPLTREERADSIHLQKKWNNATNQNKYNLEEGKCGCKIKKKACGSKLKAKKGIKTKACPKCGKVHSGKCQKHEMGGILAAMKKFKNGGSLKSIPFIKKVQ